jgi:integrase
VPNIRFTDMTIVKLPPGEYWDAKFPSFGVRVGKNTKTFLLKKNNSRVKIGSYPATSLADARIKAHGLKAAPNTPDASQTTLEDAVDLFLANHCKNYRPRSIAEMKRLLGKLSSLETRKLTAITTQEVHALIDKLPTSEANHLFKASRTFFRFCVRRRIGSNPLEGLSVPNKEQSRARVLTDAELRAIWDACDGTHGVIVKLLILTGQRRGELSALRWEWVDEEARTISFPASITKNARSHTIPCGQLTYNILDSIGSEGLFFIARHRDTPFNGWSKSKAVLDRLSGVTGWTLHDLRRTFASNLAALGVRLEVIEKLLNHVSGSFAGVAGIYNRYDFFPEMKAAIDLWEARLAKIVNHAQP